MAGERKPWTLFLMAEALAVVATFGLFVMLEQWLWAEASVAFLGKLHVARGLSTGLVAVAVGAWFFRALLNEVKAESERWFRFLDSLQLDPDHLECVKWKNTAKLFGIDEGDSLTVRVEENPRGGRQMVVWRAEQQPQEE